MWTLARKCLTLSWRVELWQIAKLRPLFSNLFVVAFSCFSSLLNCFEPKVGWRTIATFRFRPAQMTKWRPSPTGRPTERGLLVFIAWLHGNSSCFDVYEYSYMEISAPNLAISWSLTTQPIPTLILALIPTRTIRRGPLRQPGKVICVIYPTNWSQLRYIAGLISFNLKLTRFRTVCNHFFAIFWWIGVNFNDFRYKISPPRAISSSPDRKASRSPPAKARKARSSSRLVQ